MTASQLAQHFYLSRFFTQWIWGRRKIFFSFFFFFLVLKTTLEKVRGTVENKRDVEYFKNNDMCRGSYCAALEAAGSGWVTQVRSLRGQVDFQEKKKGPPHTRRAVRQLLEMGLQASSVSHITDNSIPSRSYEHKFGHRLPRVGIQRAVILAHRTRSPSRISGIS